MASNKKILIGLVVGLTLAFSASVSAINITVPAPGGTGYFLKSTNSTTYGTTTDAISQFTNDSGYVTSSIVTGYISTTTGNWLGTWQLFAPTDFLSSSTEYVSTSTGNWLGTWQLFSPTDFLSSMTPHVATSTTETVAGLEYDADTAVLSTSAGYVGLVSDASSSYWSAKVGSVSPFTVGYVPYATSPSVITDSVLFQSGANIGIGTTTPATALVVDGTILARGDLDESNVGYGFIGEATSTGIHRQAAGAIDVNVPTQFRVDIGGNASIYDFQSTALLFAPSNSIDLGSSGNAIKDVYSSGTIRGGTLATNDLVNTLVWADGTGQFIATTTPGGISLSSLSATGPLLSYDNGTGVFSTAYTPASSTRTINTTWPITGGGDLTADRTFALAYTPASSTVVGSGVINRLAYYDAASTLNDFATGTPNQVLGMTAAGTGHEYKTVTGSPYLQVVNTANTITLNNLGVQTLMSATGTITFATSSTGTDWSITRSGTVITMNHPKKIESLGAISTTTGSILVGRADTTGWYRLPVGANGTVLGASSTASSGVAWVLAERCDMAFLIENPTSTAGHVDQSPGDMFPVFFNKPSTITKVKAVNTKAGDTVSFNLTYNSSRNSATSTYRVFSSQQTITSTSTVTVLTPNASSTPSANDILRINFTAASSSQFSVNVCYTEQ